MEPVPWKSHAGYGRKSFNPRYKEKEYVQWKLKQHWKKPPISEPVSISYRFRFSIPKSFSKKKREHIKNGTLPCLIRKDTSNLVKFTEDCLKQIVIVDDAQVVKLMAEKSYSDHPSICITLTAWRPHGSGKSI
jgi:Holliday junction resolvase RusA-like endonuclease